MFRLPRDRMIRRLGVFQALASFSELVAFFAAAIVAFDRTGSTLVVSAVMTTATGAEAVGAILGGTAADRFDRKRVALMAAVAAAILLLVLAFGTNLVVLTLLIVAMTLVVSPIRPAVFAALPNLAVEGPLEEANGYLQTLRNAAFTLSPVLAGVGVGTIGARGLFLVAGVVFGLAALVLLTIRGPFHAEAPAGVPRPSSPFAGLDAIRGDRVLSILIAANVVSILTAAWALVADLPFAKEELDAGSTGYGLIVAAWGAGSMLGAILAPQLIRRRGAVGVFVASLLLEGVGLAGAAIAPTLALACLAFVAGGVGGGWLAVADSLLIQRRTPDAVLGRVRATSDAAGSIGYTLSLALGGPLVAAVGARPTYAISGVGCVLAGLLALVGLRALRADEEP